MIIINLSGGLGNQMFQYAFGRSLSNKCGYEFKLDGEYYFTSECQNSDVPRQYLLNKFNIQSTLANASEIKKVYSIGKKIIRKIKSKFYRNQEVSNFNSKYMMGRDNHYYIGFWQNEKYFINIRDLILKDFNLKEPMSNESQTFLSEINKSQHPISIHIRRTDILNPANVFGGICDEEYYKVAINRIEGEIKTPTYFVFSDDIEWCRKNLSSKNTIHFVSNANTRDYEELILMSKCEHNIIANSSFSWWGAWLNQNPDKIILAPKKWVRLGEENFKDIIPSSWIRI